MHKEKMNKRLDLKVLAYNFAYAVLAIILVFVIVVFLLMIVWDVPSCQEDSEAVAYARSLKPERLERLYYDMERYSHRDDVPLNGYIPGDERHEVPEEFSDLKVRIIRPNEGNIMVEGCFDHYIYLRFTGIGMFADSERKQIILNWGERPPEAGTQVLWSGE